MYAVCVKYFFVQHVVKKWYITVIMMKRNINIAYHAVKNIFLIVIKMSYNYCIIINTLIIQWIII